MRLDSWNKIEFIFTFKFHIDPFSLRNLEYYTIENLLKEYEDYIDRENKEYQKQNNEIEKQQRKMNIDNKVGNFKVPKYEIPKI